MGIEILELIGELPKFWRLVCAGGLYLFWLWSCHDVWYSYNPEQRPDPIFSRDRGFFGSIWDWLRSWSW